MFKVPAKYSTILMLIFCSGLLFGQSPKELKKMKRNAVSYFSLENYAAAYPILKEIYAEVSNDYEVTFMLGYCEMEYTKDYSAVINYFESTKINSPEKSVPTELYLLLGDAYHFSYDFNNSIKNYNKYKSVISKTELETIQEVNRLIKSSIFAEQLYTSPEAYKKMNLGGTINSNKGDYAPVISADESTLMFTSRRVGGVNSEMAVDGDPYEDIYISKKQPNSEWGDALLMSEKINTLLHDATSAITVDGQRLFIYRSNKNDQGGRMYESYLKGVEWGVPVLLGDNINAKDWVNGVTITPDEQTLYFISDKKRGIGKKDIYVSQKMNDGTWGVAKNLGGIVNTVYDEESPFIHPDGKTLFFSSKGHDNMGGYDVFKTVFDGTSWSVPENLGYPLNSTLHDLHFVLSANGKNGYYTSTGKSSYGDQDIYQIVMPKANIPLTMIRGTILCADSLKPLEVVIKMRDVETNKFIKHVYKPNPETGKYLIILPPGKNYDMIITAIGYIPYKVNVFIPEQKEFYELYQTIYIKAIHPFDKKIGQAISIDNAFFNKEGSIVDIDEERIQTEELRQKRLQNLLNHIISQSDSLSMQNFNDIAESNFDVKYKNTIVDTSFNSLLNLINEVIENTDSTALKHITNIIERGLYTYAEKNIYFYGDSTGDLKDTMRVNTNDFELVQPLTYTDTTDFGVGEKNEMFSAEKVSASDQVVFNAILFDNKQYNLKEEYIDILYQFVEVYKRYPSLNFSITGHADNVGSEQYNLLLSKKRVKVVERFLVKAGIPIDKIKVQWKGEASPINLNKTDQERAENRKVEIRLFEKY